MHKVGFSWSLVWTAYALPSSPPRTEAEGCSSASNFPLSPIPTSRKVLLSEDDTATSSEVVWWDWEPMSPLLVDIDIPCFWSCLDQSQNCSSPTPGCCSNTHLAQSHPISHFWRYFSGRVLVPFWELMHLVAVERNSLHKPAYLLRASSLLFKILVWTMHNIIHDLKITILIILLDMKSNS